jgi:glycosyltransferase involved in cell wall biosynthesis
MAWQGRNGDATKKGRQPTGRLSPIPGNEIMKTSIEMQVPLTIVVPTLNCEATLSNTLVSLMPLARSKATVVVVDGYSQDGTIKIAESYGVKVYQLRPGNMYEAINFGLAQASSEWVTYLNGDDLVYADAIMRALRTLGENADVIYGSIDFVDEAGRFLHSWNSSFPADILPVAGSHRMPIPQQGTLFRRALAARLDGFSTAYKFASDFDFFVRAKLSGASFARLDWPRIAAFRVRRNQISQVRQAEMKEEVAESVRQNKITLAPLQKKKAIWKLRRRNWDSYLLRLLRSKHLKGKVRIDPTIAEHLQGKKP